MLFNKSDNSYKLQLAQNVVNGIRTKALWTKTQKTKAQRKKEQFKKHKGKNVIEII